MATLRFGGLVRAMGWDMAKQWHYSKGGQRLGPVSGDELRAMASDGRLAPTDLIWSEGKTPDWMPASSAKGLFPQQAVPPPLPPSAARAVPPPIPASAAMPAPASAAHEPGDDEDYDEPPERVGFGPRVGAVLIDTVAMVVAAVVLGGVVGLVAASKAGNPIEAEAFFIRGFTIAAGLAGILYGLWEGLTGAAAGKLATGLIIANADGTPAEKDVLFKRFMFKNGIASLFSLIGGATNSEIYNVIGGLWGVVFFCGCFVALGEKRQALHDMIAHTAVYRKADVAGVGPP